MPELTHFDAAGHAHMVDVGGKPETGVADGKGNVYVNIEDKREIVRIDTAKLTVADHYPLAGCDEPSALAMDTVHRRLFAGCAIKIVAVVDPDGRRKKGAPADGWRACGGQEPLPASSPAELEATIKDDAEQRSRGPRRSFLWFANVLTRVVPC